MICLAVSTEYRRVTHGRTDVVGCGGKDGRNGHDKGRKRKRKQEIILIRGRGSEYLLPNP